MKYIYSRGNEDGTWDHTEVRDAYKQGCGVDIGISGRYSPHPDPMFFTCYQYRALVPESYGTLREVKGDAVKKKVYGVGVNDADYSVNVKEELTRVDGKRKQKVIWRCPYYNRWVGMLERCYSKVFHAKYPTYRGCTVCEDWLTFSNFKMWMETQDWSGKHLDKDILLPGNKLYSPDTCVFISPLVNTFVLEGGSSGEESLIGAIWYKAKGKYTSQCNDSTGGRIHLGYFDTAEEAHAAWLRTKLSVAKEIAANLEDERVAKALVSRYQDYQSGDRV